MSLRYKINYLLAVFILAVLFSFYSKADELLNINNISFRNLTGQSTTIYLDIENNSNKLEYLLGVEIVGHKDIKTNIFKTVIDQNIAKIIKIDRLAIPAKSVVKLKPRGIYLVINKNMQELSPVLIRFIFSEFKLEKHYSK